MATWSDFLDPIQMISIVKDAFAAWDGQRVLALGESGTGKTTFWHYAQHNSPAPTDLERTTEVEQLRKFAVHDLKRAFVSQRVRAVDVPGHLRLAWKEALQTSNPHGILFMCDHATGHTAPEPDQDRLESHADALRHVRGLLEVVETPALRRFAIVMNKSDCWRARYTRMQLLDRGGITAAYTPIGIEHDKLSVAVRDSSALNGDNVKTVLSYLTGH